MYRYIIGLVVTVMAVVVSLYAFLSPTTRETHRSQVQPIRFNGSSPFGDDYSGRNFVEEMDWSNSQTDPILSKLAPPIDGLKPGAIHDTYNDVRGAGRRHEAVDMMAPRGTPVRAVTSGKIAKLFVSKPGGLTIYQFDATEKYCFYYAHLAAYAAGLAEGREVLAGDLIGYVGSSGNAREDSPHLHLAVFELGPDKKWWEGIPINPYKYLLHAAGQ